MNRPDPQPVILIVGQTPPPHHGQAVMIQALVRHHWHLARIHHVRMAFSETMDQVGAFHPEKILKLFRVLAGILKARILHQATVLYYPPAGGNRVPVLRDLFLLILSRWLFKKTVFHFHADGLTDFLKQAPFWIRFPARLAYHGADLAILTSKGSHIDTDAMGCRSRTVIPNGVHGPVQCPVPKPRGIQPKLLFIGAITPSKGVEVLLDALDLLLAQNLNFHLDLVGDFRCRDFESHLTDRLKSSILGSRVQFHGVLTDHAKDQMLEACDLFVFPSYYEAETFGLVLAEAMAFGKPVITTSWSGLPETVGQDGLCGKIVPPKDPRALARAIHELLEDPETARLMGTEARKRFEAQFSLPKHLQLMEEALFSVASSQQPVWRSV